MKRDKFSPEIRELIRRAIQLESDGGVGEKVMCQGKGYVLCAEYVLNKDNRLTCRGGELSLSPL